MKIGIATTDFTPNTTERLFEKIAALGFGSAQFAFASVTETGFIPDGRIEIPPAINPAVINNIIKNANARNITIPAVNGTFNMAHPNGEVRLEGIRRMDGFARAARELGAGVISLCSGTRDETHLWTHHGDNHTEAAWRDMFDTMARAIEIAERYGLILAVETEYSNVVDTPQRARRMINELKSPRLKIVMDCANLFQPGTAYKKNAASVMESAFAILGGDVVLAHGKDIAESDGIVFCPTGEGIVDFGLFIKLLKRHGYEGDMILHGIYDEAKMPLGIETVARMAI
jgi:sugar phosphate isomerase/epimerase